MARNGLGSPVSNEKFSSAALSSIVFLLLFEL